MPKYPADSSLFTRAMRPLNLLDDVENKFSPVKVNLWAANLAGASTAFAGVLAWISGHWAMLSHATDIGSLIGPYWGGSHVWHQADKRGIAQQTEQAHPRQTETHEN